MIGALLVGLVVGFGSSVEGQCTVSQGRGPNFGLGDTQVAPLGGLKVGQSFVACGTGKVTGVTTALSYGSGGPRTVTFRLYEGAGYGGTELASKAGEVFDGNGADKLIDLTSGVTGAATVVSGEVYTFSLEVAETTSNAVTMLFMNNNQNGNPYQDGAAYNMAGEVQANSDLYFTIDISAPSVRYELTAYGWKAHFDLSLEQDTCSGEIHFYKNRSGTDVDITTAIKDCQLVRDPNFLYIKFRRVDNDQYYQGWGSINEQLFGGWYQSGKGRKGWHAYKAP